MIRPVRFLVVDDHPVFRRGLIELLRQQPFCLDVTEAGDFEETLARCAEGRFGLVSMDLTLGDRNSLQLITDLRSLYPDQRILVLSMHDEALFAERSLKAGAHGFIMKQEAPETILEAIQTVLNGKVFLSSAMRDKLVERMFSDRGEGHSSGIELLTNRELEVVRLIGTGHGVSEIAAMLNLSVKTIDTYREHIKTKLRMESAQALRKFAVAWVQKSEDA
jgi:DNA-binding NarL/FixJ family response regulator